MSETKLAVNPAVVRDGVSSANLQQTLQSSHLANPAIPVPNPSTGSGQSKTNG
jgi:hypothetical protein